MQDEKINDRELLNLIYKSDKQQEIILEVNKLLEAWQSLSLPEQIKRRSSLLYDLALLDPKDTKLCLSKLSEAGIISEKDAKEEIDKTRLALGIESDTKKDQIIYTACFDGLVDIVEDKNLPAFLVKEGDDLNVFSQIKKENRIYLPPPREQIPWLLPSAQNILDFWQLDNTLGNKKADSLLYDDLLTYHKNISELPHEAYYDLIAAWDLHTYLLDSFKYSPIICLFAVPERGKTRTGQSMIYVVYRGIHVESLRDAYLVRVANNLNATLFFDVKDIWRKAEKAGSEDILLHRFEKGATVPRVLYPERGAHRDIVYYSIFGPTVISTNEALHHILETRAIAVNMPESPRTFENDVSPESALSLKERLIAFRARHLGEPLPELPKSVSGRLGDILKPLQQIIRLVKPEKEASFLKLAKELQEARLIEKIDSLEAQIIRAVVGLEKNVVNGVLSVKEITDFLNDNKPQEHQFSYQRIGRRLQALGFKKVWTSKGTAAIIWDEVFIDRLKAAYGLKETPVTPVTPVDVRALP